MANSNSNSKPKLEIGVERVLFASRWILAPFYLGMVVALAVILVVFVRELVADLAHIPTMDGQIGRRLFANQVVVQPVAAVYELHARPTALPVKRVPTRRTPCGREPASPFSC
jgi:hypothetical protein